MSVKQLNKRDQLPQEKLARLQDNAQSRTYINENT
jgi:hypothetical protein